MERETEPSNASNGSGMTIPRAIIVETPRLGPQPPRPEPKRGQIHRPKHVPQRTCVACRDKNAKRTLTRIVRTPDGKIEIDPSGKRNGRGAYLCTQESCWQRALKTPVLARALKTEIDVTARATLQTHMDSLTDQPAKAAAVDPSERDA